MSKNPFRNELYLMSSLLSQRVSGADKFFKEIALMGIDERVSYALLYAIDEIKFFELDLDNMNEDEFIKKVILPIIQRIGQARFKADTLTHLGWKVGERTKQRDYAKE